MLTRWFRRKEIAGQTAASAVRADGRVPCGAPCASPCATPCAEPCPLTALPAGVRAVILRIGCPLADASRLRALGLFEGARVGIVGHRGGLLLDVRGARLALDIGAAAAIIAIPLAG